MHEEEKRRRVQVTHRSRGQPIRPRLQKSTMKLAKGPRPEHAKDQNKKRTWQAKKGLREHRGSDDAAGFNGEGIRETFAFRQGRRAAKENEARYLEQKKLREGPKGRGEKKTRGS